MWIINVSSFRQFPSLDKKKGKGKKEDITKRGEKLTVSLLVIQKSSVRSIEIWERKKVSANSFNKSNWQVKRQTMWENISWRSKSTSTTPQLPGFVQWVAATTSGGGRRGSVRPYVQTSSFGFLGQYVLRGRDVFMYLIIAGNVSDWVVEMVKVWLGWGRGGRDEGEGVNRVSDKAET